MNEIVICNKEELTPIADVIRDLEETTETFNTTQLVDKLNEGLSSVAEEQESLINEINDILNGKIINSIRTIVQASSSLEDNKKVRINVESY